MSKNRLRNQKAKSNSSKSKIKERARKIRQSGNVVEWSEDYIEKVMRKYGISNYKVSHWGGITIVTKLSEWRIEHDEVVISLKHSSRDVLSFQNDRGSYHLQNVFYDLDYCVKSIVSHEEYEKNHRYR